VNKTTASASAAKLAKYILLLAYQRILLLVIN